MKISPIQHGIVNVPHVLFDQMCQLRLYRLTEGGRRYIKIDNTLIEIDTDKKTLSIAPHYIYDNGQCFRICVDERVDISFFGKDIPL